MKNKLLVTFLALFIGSYISAQVNRCSYVPPRQADNWLFVKNAGLKFADNGLTVNNIANNNLPAGNGTAAISDELGNLILYTNGQGVWNSNHDKINYGADLMGYQGCVQSSVIVKSQVSGSSYYVFTVDYPLNVGPSDPINGLRYSRVDMSLYGGTGSVTLERDSLLMGRTAEMITAVNADNGTDTWVMSHGVNNNDFTAFKVNGSGVDVNNPITTSIGEILTENNSETFGAMKFSPKGDKIACASFGKSTVEVFGFNNQNGQITSKIVTLSGLGGVNSGPYFVEFSPDGTKLYFTVVLLSTTPNNQLYQYDLVNGGAPVLLNDAALSLQQDVGAIQVARNGKIYISHYNKSFIGVVENPNRPGLACNFNETGIDLAGARIYNGLTNFNQSFFDVPPVDYDTKCDGDQTEFYLLNTSNIDQAGWDFGDPLSGASNIVTNELTPIHLFSGPGDYNVTLTETFGSGSYITTFPVHIDSLPPKAFMVPPATFIDSLYIFPGSTIPLDAGPDMFSYLWQDGSNNRFFQVTDAGDYSVEYTDIRCCTNSDTLRVIALDIKLPTAFTPNSDNLNDIFRAMGPTDGIEDFTLTIYNRWGQLVWEANGFDDGWSGTYSGVEAPAGIYAWNMTFNVKGNVMEQGKIIYRGSVTLLR